MRSTETYTATVNYGATVHLAYTHTSQLSGRDEEFTLCNGERMGYQRTAQRVNREATCKRCIKSAASR